jgi:hypothetical protein
MGNLMNMWGREVVGGNGSCSYVSLPRCGGKGPECGVVDEGECFLRESVTEVGWGGVLVCEGWVFVLWGGGSAGV